MLTCFEIHSHTFRSTTEDDSLAPLELICLATGYDSTEDCWTQRQIYIWTMTYLVIVFLKPLLEIVSNLKLKCITSIYYLNMSYIFWYSEEIKLQWPRKPPAGKTLILMAASSPLLKIISFDPSIWKTRFYKQLLVSYTRYHNM